MRIYKNVEEIAKEFRKKGWGEDTTFTEVTIEEAVIRGLLFAVSDIKAGRKIFKMNETGNIYNQSGDLLMYNIPIVRDPDSPIKFPLVKNVIKGCMSKYDIDEITFLWQATSSLVVLMKDLCKRASMIRVLNFFK